MVPSLRYPRVRVGWWALPEISSPLDALRGMLLRAEVGSRLEGFSPVLVTGGAGGWTGPGFTGEPVAAYDLADLANLANRSGGVPGVLDVLVASGSAGPDGQKVSHALADAGGPIVAVAPSPDWGIEPEALNIGPPFAVPEPTLLAARHIPKPVLDARGAYLRVVEGLPRRYVLVEGGLLDGDGWAGPADLEGALSTLAEWASKEDARAEVVALASAGLGEAAGIDPVLRQRRAEAEEGRHLAEDWPGDPDRPRLALRVQSPVDLAAAVAGAGVVVAHRGALMALAWALGVPHVAVGDEGSPASNFAAWTGDASALVDGPGQMVATIANIFGRRGRPPGLRRLEATLDQCLDEASAQLEETMAKVDGYDLEGAPTGEARLAELVAANEALRQRLAAERLRFGERSALLEKAAATSVESAIKAVRGQDVIVRRRLEQVEREMRRLQEETAVQQAELRAIYATKTMKVLVPAREFYGRMRKAAR